MKLGGVPPDFDEKFWTVLGSGVGVPEYQRSYYRRWLAEFMVFCQVRHLEDTSEEGLSLYLESLRKLGRMGFQIEQAKISVQVFWKYFRMNEKGDVQKGVILEKETPAKVSEIAEDWSMAILTLTKEIKLRHYSLKTMKAYKHWVLTYGNYLKMVPTTSLTEKQAREFLVYLALERKVSASTQNQAFSALLFFYVNVLGRELKGLEKTPRGSARLDIPTVLSRSEVQLVLSGLEHPYKLFVQLLYGCGLRLNEALTLRIQDLDFTGGSLRVHNGKGDKSRILPLPRMLVPALEQHLVSVRALFESDLRVGYAGVFLPEALEHKYLGASRSWPWQWVFPGGKLTISEADQKLRRFHLHETSVQKEIKSAGDSANLSKRVTAHTFRHSYATHLLQMGYDIRTLQILMGHNDVSTTMIYTHVIQATSGKVISPLDV